jgi:hypothetical protein
MFDKTIFLKILLLISFLITIGVIWLFAGYVSQNNNSNTEVIYIQSSNQSQSSLFQSSSSTISSSSNLTSSSSMSSSVESSSSSSLNSIVLENNLSIISDIELIIEKPNPEIQAQIKAAKNRPKVETKSSISQSISSTQESITSTTDKP